MNLFSVAFSLSMLVIAITVATVAFYMGEVIAGIACVLAACNFAFISITKIKEMKTN